MKTRSLLVASALFAVLLAGVPPVSAAEEGLPAQPERFTPRTVSLAETLPIQEGGRVKPLSTFARFSLISMRGLAGCYNLDDVRISPTEWLLDSLFHPEVARHYRIFLVQDDGILVSLGVKMADRKRRDRYSYVELLPGRKELRSLAAAYQDLSGSELAGQKEQILNLHHSLQLFESIMEAMDFAREEYPAKATPRLAELFSDVSRPGFGDILARLPRIAEMSAGLAEGGGDLDPDQRRLDLQAIGRLENSLQRAARAGFLLNIFPPPEQAEDEEEWYSAGDIVARVAAPAMPAGKAAAAKQMSDHIGLLRDLEALQRTSDDPAAFQVVMEEIHEKVVGLAEARGEYGKIGLEVFFYKLNPFSYALYGFIAAFVVLALTWLMPRLRWLMAAAFGLVSLSALLVVAGIALRCIIRARPPVTTLYETILFITAVGVLTAMVIEYLNRRRMAIILAALLGAAGLFLAEKYEFHKRVDTMPTLVAVLDTNFWLTIHVITISIGYTGGLLAAFIGNLYILLRLVNFKRNDPLFFRSLARAIYGVTCFGLLFSVVGTLTGGLWANDSWGRFWGWDPKENGALLICLWMTIVIHLKIARYVRDLGLAIAAVLGGMVVVFSWWGVNLLGVGLHSYGFTSGILWILLDFGYIQIGVMFLGLVVWMLNRFLPMEPPDAGAPPGEPEFIA